jgi:hypothetical protein
MKRTDAHRGYDHILNDEPLRVTTLYCNELVIPESMELGSQLAPIDQYHILDQYRPTNVVLRYDSQSSKDTLVKRKI